MKIQLTLTLLLFFSFAATSAHCAAPTTSDITISDVTPVGFSVLWNSSRHSFSDLRVFSDPAGTVDISTQVSIISQPLKGTHTSVKSFSETKGVMQVQVAGLTPDTTYYFQTITQAADSGELRLSPETGPFPSVITRTPSDRTMGYGSGSSVISNDLIRLTLTGTSATTQSSGVIVSLNVPDSDYPVTGVVGDGIEPRFACIDTSNLYNASTGEFLELQGAETLEITKFLGITGVETIKGKLMPLTGLTTLRPSFSLAEVVESQKILGGNPSGWIDTEYDINGNNRIGLEEGIYFLRKISEVN